MTLQRKLFGLLFALFALSGCSKTDQEVKDLYQDSPGSAVPEILLSGIWFWGGFGPIAYYNDNGHEVGNETEAARQYVFSEQGGKGRIEFMQYLGLRNSSDCVTEIFTTKKGTVVFTGSDKLIFYPVEGNFKTTKHGCSGDGTTVRQANKEELQPENYLYKLTSWEGKMLLYIYAATDTSMEDPIFVYTRHQ
ncbi:hypothetical protein [Flavihumibacter petaseus]|uniref:Lipoprotein n=1 Tax=Flavihumibacter petaseus NBRC 106054 TaxID=1220578 RepID=A0A0E9N4C4_9BACT|nr:hypothetical protein [Flavihumibacter petaseus]GAO44215.1 hypothetical protein FPE01S_03_02530 [Flavihumibacter petaseus NBRC 106054]